MSLGSGIGIRKKSILDPGSRGQKGTGSRIRNTEILLTQVFPVLCLDGPVSVVPVLLVDSHPAALVCLAPVHQAVHV
jgi:hypothetical protein